MSTEKSLFSSIRIYTELLKKRKTSPGMGFISCALLNKTAVFQSQLEDSSPKWMFDPYAMCPFCMTFRQEGTFTVKIEPKIRLSKMKKILTKKKLSHEEEKRMEKVTKHRNEKCVVITCSTCGKSAKEEFMSNKSKIADRNKSKMELHQKVQRNAPKNFNANCNQTPQSDVKKMRYLRKRKGRTDCCISMDVKETPNSKKKSRLSLLSDIL